MPTSLKIFLGLSCLIVLCEAQKNAKNYGHSKLVLFRGKERREIDGKSCTVGTAFATPEQFSCACVNGIWAFYNEACKEPIAMVGGHNFCFKMPKIPLRLATTVSSPMRALSHSLTVFELNMESVKTKIFRNVHMQLDGINDFVTMNSSWTLVSPDGKESICLNSKDAKLDGFIMEGTTEKSEAVFCTFRNVSQRIPKIGSIVKGCNESAELFEPIDCQPVLQPNSEGICTSLPVLEAFADKDEGQGNDLESFRAARSSLLNWAITTTTTTTTTAKPTTTTTTNRYPPGYEKSPGWMQREIRKMVDSKNFRGFGRASKKEADHEKEHKSDSDILEMVKKEWDNPMDFTLPPPSHSDPIIIDQLWKYQRKSIREQLKIKTPDDLIIFESNTSSKASQLLFITRDVMKKICPLQKPEYFDMITDVFLQIQKKIFRWKEPYVKTLDFKRIEAALTACRESAKPLVTSGKSCTETPDASPAPALVPMPKTLKSDGYEPIIESVWKILVSAHSFCYKNFNQFFNDHHKFTTIMFPFFTNEIHHHWFRNGSKNEDENDYAGIIGPVKTIIANIDRCTFAARTNSSYPFHLTRPTPLVQYDSGKEKYDLSLLPDSKESGDKDSNDSGEESSKNSKDAKDSTETEVKDSKDSTDNSKESINSKESKDTESKDSETKKPEEMEDSKDAEAKEPEGSDSKDSETKDGDDKDAEMKDSDVKDAETKDSDAKDSTDSEVKSKRKRRDVKGRSKRGGRKVLTPKKSEKKSPTVELGAWKKERRVMGGLGFCLKKYNEPKVHLGYNC